MSILRTAARAAAVLAAVAAPALAHAQQQTATTTGTVAGKPVAASAAFTFGSGSLTVVLSNTLAPSALVSSGQGISGFSFTLNTNITGVTSQTVAGQLATLQNGTGGTLVTYTSGSPTRFLDSGDGFSGSTFTSNALGGGQPDELILPQIANGSRYANANAGVDNFTPGTVGSVTYSFFSSAFTTATRVTAASFSFGTQPELTTSGTVTTNVPGSVVPEPSTYALMGAGLAGLAAAARRRRQA